jgi:hypothetical protein
MFVMCDAQTLRCSRCGERKPADEFAWRRRNRDQRDTMCRPCRSAYGKEHAANRQRYIDRAKAKKQQLTLERTRWLIGYFAAHPCVDCGEADPIVLEFDHLRDKSFAIGPKLAQTIWQRILAEIDKCEVVCANCHRRRAAKAPRGSARPADGGLVS